ncbi:sporulation integral membrane protein YtvI [Bacillus sp. FJAT-44742]|uniref:sporulation integral membrane protein YtvI n=1 Tax=Bacillus sp. FJAT-44742 TaxID=2014005 RepID=UPI000C23B115|nr:sporulation integral membrane protein YtvI [Bacillus sp. FJAT-44742]
MTKEQGWMIFRFAGSALTIVILIWLISQIFSLTYPFWIAAFITWMLMPLVRILQEKLRFPAGLASLIGLLTGISLIGGVITGITFLIIYGVRNFSEQLPQWFATASINIQQFFNEVVLPFWHQLTGLLDNMNSQERQTLEEGIVQLGAQLGNILGTLGQGLADWLTSVAVALPTLLVVFFFVLLSVFFLGKDWKKITKWVTIKVPESIRMRGLSFGRAMRIRVFGFLKAQFILMTITFIIVLLGLAILDIEHALTIAVVVGVAELLPYLGTGTILIPWFVYLFITGQIGLGITLAILYGIIVIVRQLVEPKVLSSSMNLHPLAVLISLFAGLQLFGAIGLFLGPLLLVIIVILIDIGVVEDIKNFILFGWAPSKKE